MENNYSRYIHIIEEFKKCNFENGKHVEPNFFSVAGFPHRENVMSNILQFFFDTDAEHGFNNLWLKALILAYNDKNPSEVIKCAGIKTLEAPEKEYSNGSDKRIDLLINCYDVVIVIENKIDATLYNDLHTYTKMVENYIKDKKLPNPKVVKIVLSLSPIKEKIKDGYINITYEDLFNKISGIINQYEIQGKWAILMDEFIDNLKQEKETSVMNNDMNWIQFVNNNNEDIKALINKYEVETRSRLDFLRAINECLSDLTVDHGVFSYYSSSYMSQYCDIKMDGGKNLVVETCLLRMPTNKKFERYDHLYICLWRRKDKNYNFDEILKALGKENAEKAVTTDRNSWGVHYALDQIELNNKTLDANDIANKIRNYVQIISEYVNKLNNK